MNLKDKQLNSQSTVTTSSINQKIDYLVYRGRWSKLIAESLLLELKKINLKVRLLKESAVFGLDRQRVLFLYDKKFLSSGKFFSNQGLRNNVNFAYSIRINNYKKQFLRSIVNQLKADYFVNFYRNINLFGYPWGCCEKKYYKRDLLYYFSNDKDPLVKAFIIFIKSLNPVFYSVANIKTLINWIKSGHNCPLNIFIMICPDYDCFIDDFGRSIKYKFNNTLDCGIGLVAQRALEVIADWHCFANNNNLKINYILGMADYEDYPENLKKFKETKKSFHQKISLSNKLVNEQINAQGWKSSVQIVMIQEYLGEKKWQQLFYSCDQEIKQIVMGPEFKHIITQRRKLYKKMGYTFDQPSMLINKIIKQAREYYCVGALLNKKDSQPLILGLNSINMEVFYNLKSTLPILYLNKIYD